MPNVELLKRVRDRIAGIPAAAFNMHVWQEGPALDAEAVPRCGSAGCLAGWTLAVADGRFKAEEWESGDSIADAASDLLGLDDRDLFTTTTWPHKYRNMLGQRFEVAAEVHGVNTDDFDYDGYREAKHKIEQDIVVLMLDELIAGTLS